jgi:hypothetical protein
MLGKSFMEFRILVFARVAVKFAVVVVTLRFSSPRPAKNRAINLSTKLSVSWLLFLCLLESDEIFPQRTKRQAARFTVNVSGWRNNRPSRMYFMLKMTTPASLALTMIPEEACLLWWAGRCG